MHATGVDASELREAGYEASELLDAGYSSAEVYDAQAMCEAAFELDGYDVEDLLDDSLDDVTEAGYTAVEMMCAGDSFCELLEAGCAIGDLEDAVHVVSNFDLPSQLPALVRQQDSRAKTRRHEPHQRRLLR